MARTWLMIWMSRPAVLCSCRYILTLVMSCASWGRYWSSQNTTGMPELRARLTASLTQSRMAASLTWHMRQMSPSPTSWLSSTSPVAMSTMLATPSSAISKVLSCEPYSSACWAIRPTLGTVPMVFGSKAPCHLQKLIISW
ncbi:MAG: hypothetical protein BWX79_02668 [Alphaproteobacteria bacterium ADurb.Bin100]|nr:MAG: hypothetical protein BWX79_02668 [Alphaproteobacteria bacterium ADurb.Bin100]